MSKPKEINDKIEELSKPFGLKLYDAQGGKESVEGAIQEAAKPTSGLGQLLQETVKLPRSSALSYNDDLPQSNDSSLIDVDRVEIYETIRKLREDSISIGIIDPDPVFLAMALSRTVTGDKSIQELHDLCGIIESGRIGFNELREYMCAILGDDRVNRGSFCDLEVQLTIFITNLRYLSDTNDPFLDFQKAESSFFPASSGSGRPAPKPRGK